ncbi:MAG: BamA/TamA family outer membrane protein, partial [Myxococcota bacterium]
IGPRLPLTSNLDPNGQQFQAGANIGGNLSYHQNLELEFPVLQAVGLRGVVFTDLGNAWNLEQRYCQEAAAQFQETDPCFQFTDIFTTMRLSAGFGLRWFSPLGPLRFEWGFPFDPLPFEQNNRFDFTIGNFF